MSMTSFFRSNSKWGVGAALCASLCASPLLAQSPGPGPVTPSSKTDAKVTQLQKIDVKTGTGAEAAAGKVVFVHYTGWLYDPTATGQKGAKFDSSRDRGTPFNFPLGGGQVIRGWDEGVAGMKVGGKRKLTIPPEMGYGARGVGPIPPNSTLVFEVDLLAVK